MRNFFLSLAVLFSGFAIANEVKTVNEITTSGVVVEDIATTANMDFNLYLQGIEDGKEFAKNKGGNLVVGFLTGLIGTGVVALTSDQKPSYEAISLRGEDITNDIEYRRGYSKGARSKAVGNSFIGVGAFLLLILL